jgi:dienelactone hydrolase
MAIVDSSPSRTSRSPGGDERAPGNNEEFLPLPTVEREVEFLSNGITCRGLFVRPDSNIPAPLMILVHGLGGVYEMRLDAFARRFAAAGYAALTFDYRHFGRSDGHPRHRLVREEQQYDIETAIAYGKTLEGVDASRVILWGTSLAGGHVIDVASRRTDLSASIIQCPFTDGPSSALRLSVLSMIGVIAFAAADAIARLLGRPSVLVPLAGIYGMPALMTASGAVQGVVSLFPPGSRFSRRLSRFYTTFAARRVKLGSNVTTSEADEPFANSGSGSILFPSGTVLINGVSGMFGLQITSWRPGKRLSKLEAPMLVCVCEGDSVAPAKRTLRYARAAPRCEVKVYPYDHFDIYTGEPYAIVSKDQLEFLARTVPVQIGSPRIQAVRPD